MARETTRLQTIAFFGRVPANARRTITSKRIEVPFRVKKVTASFAPGVNRLMNLEFYISPDDSAPTVKPLTGINILGTLGHVGFLTGDDGIKSHEVEMETITAGYYVKVFANNRDAFAHTIDAQVLIELIYQEKEEEKKE
ncbi:MAG: hypothetical protein DDT22_00902 [candidate division WS2 bacterium]|nr:hypothetical protein [Candidatus Lithacetigena glycinireducens]